MILSSTPMGGPWKRGSGAFLLSNSLSLFLIWMILDIVNKPQNFTGPAWLAVLLISIVLYIFEITLPVKRLKHVILILGIFVALPMLIFFSLPIFACLELSRANTKSKVLVYIFYFFPIGLWSVFQSIKVIALQRREKYFEKEVSIEGKIGYFDADSAQDLGDPEKSHVRDLGATPKRAMIFFLVSITYPLQRYLAEFGGDAAVFLLASIFSLPVLMYGAGKICSGYVLWIYLAGKFEKKNNLTILLKS